MNKNNVSRWLSWCMDKLFLFCMIGTGILICMPIVILFCGSFTDAIEWEERTVPLLLDNQEYISWKWIPDYPTLENYKELLFYAPDFLVLFWNSIKIAACILVGHLLIGIPGAWFFAVYQKGRGVLFFIYIVLMLLPFQATMLAKYMVLNSAGLLDSEWAVILPSVFSTFPVFLIYRGFRRISVELFEVARIDGANEWTILVKIGMPLAESSITSAFVLSFFEVWNMVEEPLAFLKDMSLWPLSLFLAQIDATQAGRACAASVITLIVSFFVFGIFKDSLEQGIVSSALKG